jgi:hypothetical protein
VIEQQQTTIEELTRLLEVRERPRRLRTPAIR